MLVFWCHRVLEPCSFNIRPMGITERSETCQVSIHIKMSSGTQGVSEHLVTVLFRSIGVVERIEVHQNHELHRLWDDHYNAHVSHVCTVTEINES